MPFKNCTIWEEFTPEGTKALRVTGKLICQADRHAFNAKVDDLAPSKDRIKPNQAYIIDISGVSLIGKPGYQAIMYAVSRFRSFGGRVSVSANKELVENRLWSENISSAVQVFASFLDAARSLNSKKEIVG